MGKAIEIYRDYSFKYEEDNVFEKNKMHIIAFLVKLKELKRKTVESELQKAKNYITSLESKGISQFKDLNSEFTLIKENVRLAELDFQTETYFGFDDCELKLEEL